MEHRVQSLRPPVARARRHKGFTLVELMVVVAIVALLLGLAAYNITRSRNRVSLERALYDLQGRVQRVQSLAAVAGSRLGPARTNFNHRLAYGAGCTVDPQRQLWIRFLGGGQVELPAGLAYDPATDVLTVQCETYDLGTITQGLGQFTAPVATPVFGFAPSGRLIVPAGVPAPIFVQVGDPSDSKTWGFRVLPSGVVCPASTPGGPLCDQETGT